MISSVKMRGKHRSHLKCVTWSLIEKDDSRCFQIYLYLKVIISNKDVDGSHKITLIFG